MRVGDGGGHGGREGALSVEVDRVRTSTKVRAAPAAETPVEEASPFARILRGLGREVDRGETLVRRAVQGANGGAQLGTGDLLALQAGVYRYSEAVDLSAKLVDRAAGGIKTVLQGQ
jgi:hypothetical protein